MVSGDQGPEIAPSSIGGVCRPMQTPEEDKCCAKRQCVASFELFCNICLNREVLSIAIRARCNIRVEEPDYESNSYRKAAFRLYIVWRFGKLGRGEQKSLPILCGFSCKEVLPSFRWTGYGSLPVTRQTAFEGLW